MTSQFACVRMYIGHHKDWCNVVVATPCSTQLIFLLPTPTLQPTDRERTTSNRSEGEAMRSSMSLISLEHINSWELDVLALSDEECYSVLKQLFATFDIFAEFNVDPAVFAAFLAAVKDKYLDNTFHNFKYVLNSDP